jgi:A/G-specific adenine glycosylase
MNTSLLESWYLRHQRPLPFRQKPSAYAIWVSEVMLQQTQMETVLNYFPKFIEAFPTIDRLAEASLEAILNLVQGIGYYRRFRLLHAGAIYLSQHHQSQLPTTYEAWLEVPGVGTYTAGAIMAIAYNQPHAATDGNVIRVLSRFYGIHDDMRLPKSRQKINTLHQQLVEKANPRIYIQAVMELGALVCRPVQPKCDVCPLKTQCQAFQKEQVNQLPVISRLKEKKNRYWQTLVLTKNQQLYLLKNTETLLQDMYLLPQWEGDIDRLENWLDTHQCSPKQMQHQGMFKHIFTHQQWMMDVYRLNIKRDRLLEGIWVPLDQLRQLPIPEAHRKIIRDMFPRPIIKSL